MIATPTTMGTRLRFYRQAQGLSRRALARASSTTTAQLFDLERDKHGCTVATLQRLALALAVTCGHLLGELPLLSDTAAREEECAHAHN